MREHECILLQSTYLPQHGRTGIIMKTSMCNPRVGKTKTSENRHHNWESRPVLKTTILVQLKLGGGGGVCVCVDIHASDDGDPHPHPFHLNRDIVIWKTIEYCGSLWPPQYVVIQSAHLRRKESTTATTTITITRTDIRLWQRAQNTFTLMR